MKEITVTISDGGKKESVTVDVGTSLAEIVKKAFPDTAGTGIYAAGKQGKKLVELGRKIFKNGEYSLVTVEEPIGYDMYKRSLVLLLLRAAADVFSECRIEMGYSLRSAYFFFVRDKNDKIYVPKKEELAALRDTMMELAAKGLPIEKKTVTTQSAIEMFRDLGMEQKAKLFRYRRASRVNLYCLAGYEDYFYGYMFPSTEGLNRFALAGYGDGIALMALNRIDSEAPKEVSLLPASTDRLYAKLLEAEDWGRQMGIRGVGELNGEICRGNLNGLIQVQEALMEKQIADIAEEIHRLGRKLVLIAGPSSSGKTTFSNRLSVQLKTHGMNPHPIAMDNYFKDRKDTPKDENGKYDFESIGAMDLELFNKDMELLLAGEEVDMPKFDFTLGEKKFGVKKLKLKPDDVLVVEGIHALNPASTSALPSDSCYKIYISALTQLHLDEHNRISNTDTRLLRRIVRDARTRGNDAAKSISMWESVRNGEEKNIFPFQGEADIMFNSALIYELPALKLYAEPLLFMVPEDSEEYYEAKRLLKFLEYFLAIDPTTIPANSLMREFIGGGCFEI